MNAKLDYYEFVNAQTENVIEHFSLPAEITEENKNDALEKKRTEVAIKNRLYVGLIYWKKCSLSK